MQEFDASGGFGLTLTRLLALSRVGTRPRNLKQPSCIAACAAWEWQGRERTAEYPSGRLLARLMREKYGYKISDRTAGRGVTLAKIADAKK